MIAVRLMHSRSRQARNPAITPFQKTSECVAKSVVRKYQTIEMLMAAKMANRLFSTAHSVPCFDYSFNSFDNVELIRTVAIKLGFST